MSASAKTRQNRRVGLVISAVMAAAALTLAGTGSSARAQAAPGWKVEPLASPAGADTSEAQMTVDGTHVILSWLDVTPKTTTLKYAERTATGWSKPQAVYSSQNFFVNAFDIPSVRRLPNGTLVAHWTEQNLDTDNDDASNVFFSWSKDNGRTWSKPASPHTDKTPTEHGFVSSYPVGHGGFGLVWIDGRATNPETEAGDMSLRASVFNASGKPVQSQTVIDPRVCECCSTAAAETSSGPIIAFRNRSAQEIRDIYVTRYAGRHWTAPVEVHDDGWKINACPINGPAISAHGNEVAVAWFMAKDSHGRAFVAFSRDGGRTFGQPVRVDDASSLGRLGVALLPDGSAAVSWIESVGGKPQFRVRRITPKGVRSAAVNVAAASGSRYSRIARHGNELLFAWTVGTAPSQVKTARIPLGH